MKRNIHSPTLIYDVRRNERMLSGQLNVCEIDWQECSYNGSTDATNKPKTYWTDDDNEVNAVVTFIPCPGCHRKHKLVVCYDPHADVPMDEWMKIEEIAREFECWNCGLEFRTDEERLVYVKVDQDPEQLGEIKIGDNQLLIPFTTKELNLPTIL